MTKLVKDGKVILLGLLIMTGSSACKKSKHLNLPKAVADLPGNWNWVMTSGGFAGITKTPASEGYNETMELKTDGTVKKYRSGNLVMNTSYTITASGNTAYPYQLQYNEAGQLPQFISFSASKDTLFLSEDCADCFGYMFVRQ